MKQQKNGIQLTEDRKRCEIEAAKEADWKAWEVSRRTRRNEAFDALVSDMKKTRDSGS